MLCNVLARSRCCSQLLAKSELPKGLLVFNSPARCGIDPALKRDNNAALLADGPRELDVISANAGEALPYGDPEGVACPDLGRPSEDCEPFN